MPTLMHRSPHDRRPRRTVPLLAVVAGLVLVQVLIVACFALFATAEPL